MRTLPTEIQLQVLESADWTQLPILAQVCHAWRDYIKRHLNTAKFLPKRYTYVDKTDYFTPDMLPLDGLSPPCDPYIHRCITHITHLIRLEDDRFHPCRIDFHDDNHDNDDDTQDPVLEAATIPSSVRRRVQVHNSADLPITVVSWRLYSQDPVVLPGGITDTTTPIPTSPLSSLHGHCTPWPITKNRIKHITTFSVDLTVPGIHYTFEPSTDIETNADLFRIIRRLSETRWDLLSPSPISASDLTPLPESLVVSIGGLGQSRGKYATLSLESAGEARSLKKVKKITVFVI
ncbi:hypothetical protein TWF281_003168 [Arthrobotrys megalospora]